MKTRFAQQDLENVYFDKSAGMYEKNKKTAAEYRGDASEHEFERLEKEVEKHIRGTGRITFIRWDGVGDDHWTVVLDTEYAALKLWYTYRHSNPPPISKGPKGWVVAI